MAGQTDEHKDRQIYFYIDIDRCIVYKVHIICIQMDNYHMVLWIKYVCTVWISETKNNCISYLVKVLVKCFKILCS